jgi:hypothetical protein
VLRTPDTVLVVGDVQARLTCSACGWTNDGVFTGMEICVEHSGLIGGTFTPDGSSEQ